MAWLSGWSYRKEISITGQSGAGTNYQVPFDIGDSAGGDFHLEGHCTNFPQDIAVTDNDETTLLDFWIEDITADPLKMWVEVADDLGSNQTIYVYYGKSGATTNSDIKDTMIFGDDFTSAVDWVNTWESNDQTLYTLSGATMQLELYGVISELLNSKTTVSAPIIIYTKLKTVDSGQIFQGSELSKGTWASLDVCGLRRVPTTQYYSNLNNVVGSTATTVSDNWHYQQITIPSSGDAEIKIWDLTTLKHTQTGTPAYRDDIYLSYYQSSADYGYIDYVYVKKYVATEPAFSSAGSEETPPTGVTIPVLMHHYNQLTRA